MCRGGDVSCCVGVEMSSCMWGWRCPAVVLELSFRAVVYGFSF